MAKQLTSVRPSTFSTFRNELLSEYLAPSPSSSKSFDVRGQQLCISGQPANQKPARAPYTLAKSCGTGESLIWVHDTIFLWTHP